MNMYGKVALGIDAMNYADLKDDLHALQPDRIRTVKTIDNTYLIFYWDYVEWDGDRVEQLIQKVKEIRHSFIRISEDGEIFTDMKISDANGCDEEFCALIGTHSNIDIWCDDTELIELDTGKARLREILDTILKNEISSLGKEACRKMLHNAGVTLKEAQDLGFGYLFDNKTLFNEKADQENPDWVITMEELNRVLAFVDCQATIDENGLIAVEDLLDGCYIDIDYFLTPQDVICHLDGSCLFEDHFLNGEVCCSHPDDFKDYAEAETVARETGYKEEADLLRIIMKALGGHVCPL